MDNQEMIITEGVSLVEAMEQLDYSPEKVLFVVREDKLVAALSDGDIRRWIVANGDINAKVAQIANYSPKYLVLEDEVYAHEYISQYDLKAIPVLDNNKKILKIVTRSQNSPA
ncbi:MAG: CBS domain-containing protein, partial [Clostridiales bacterium]|nr:CBS domain-containing protein [Clostridiales bacterium]